MYVHLSEIEILIIENIIAMEIHNENVWMGGKLQAFMIVWRSEGIYLEEIPITHSIFYYLETVQDAFTDRLWNFREMFIVLLPMGPL